MSSRVNLRSIAHKAGVSVATVSRALRDFQNVDPQTRQRIEKVARQLGYVRDPLLADAQAFVRQADKPLYRETLGFLAVDPPKPDDERVWLRGMYQGALEWAAQLGYRMECMPLPLEAAAQCTLARQLKAQGIRGVLFVPLIPRQAKLFELSTVWNEFTAVEIGKSMAVHMLPRVQQNLTEGMEVLLEQIRRRGYRRIGLAVKRNDEATRHWHVLSSCLLFERLNSGVKLFYLLEDGDDYTPTGLFRWVRRRRLDVIIGNGNYPLDWLEEYQVYAPGDIGVCRIDCVPGRRESGLMIHYEDLGRSAVEWISLSLTRGHVAQAKWPTVFTIPSVWHEGETLRPISNH